MLYEFNQGKNATEAAKAICSVNGDNSVSVGLKREPNLVRTTLSRKFQLRRQRTPSKVKNG